MAKRFYLAYGSNLNVRQMRSRCPSARIVGTGLIPDYRLMFRHSKTGAYLTIEPKKGFYVPAAVWEISEEDERLLDRYEGFPNYYYKKEMNLPVKNIRNGLTRKRRAFAYIMHEDRPYGVPRSSYVNTCRMGYRHFGFPGVLLTYALRRSEREVWG